MLALLYRILIPSFLVSFMFVPFVLASGASQTTVQIVDQNQKPLPNAVVEFFSKENKAKGDDNNNSNASDSQTKPIYIMDQINKSFVPYVLVVPKNSLVSFPNSDDLRHHVYSFSAAKTFELKLYAGKPKSPLLFSDEGIVVLGCNIHDSMVGYIYVSDEKSVYKSDENGQIIIDTALNQIDKIQIWHPNATEGVYNRKTYTQSQFSLVDDVVTLTLSVIEPEARDSFEDQFSHAH